MLYTEIYQADYIQHLTEVLPFQNLGSSTFSSLGHMTCCLKNFCGLPIRKYVDLDV